MKRVAFSDDAKTEIRAIPKPIAMRVLAAIHRFVESGSGDVKMLKGEFGAKRLRVGDFRVRFTETGDEVRVHTVSNRKDAYR